MMESERIQKKLCDEATQPHRIQARVTSLAKYFDSRCYPGCDDGTGSSLKDHS